MTTHDRRIHRSSTRLVAMFCVGVLAATGMGFTSEGVMAPIVGWAAACVTYVTWVWATIGPMDSNLTASHATREDPSRGVADILILLSSLGSLGALVFLMVQTHATTGTQRGVLAAAAVLSVGLSWVLVHTLFTLRYASLYYAGPDGGVDFNQPAPPNYGDFAYLGFTLGMTFQVSDTSIQDHRIRMTALRHGLLSYVFGSFILATLINLVAGLLR
ncbi:DUF1345 domain-containing protein [Cryobacterium sp. TMT1-21]|uniref:DUF1345 domain-containing protein n=1 Tax=Cryobacterium shii TaxID=1259235 RepID=A0AAQ2C6T8_9MICO|nr:MULTISPECIES: DUF1345 domain-containing protein [Cryobacterium]TFC48578.1 DUF1345 domain-containing protein [Cryobacterium shii]TFC81821.1 DUF1345 domain-containing protein [Cryobacterium sp. TmT2-59]TFD08273.1 DUF1345 domain-containing protein [Cryobacterium sp. TMT1-21]TFD20685.1 DUF1345 domain-containing protein [Cryobacterium sp. TMT4-10]TFD24665.1 DUF1345 domain-containing protein [Cryobacterium sp. TMT2-23]